MDLLDTNWLIQLKLTIQVLIAAVLGGVVGYEREKAERPAGLRTHALLASAACLLVGLTDILINQTAEQSLPQLLRADPIRVVEAIVTGVAFIGAGTIFRHRKEKAIEGLTTATSLLLVAAIGVAVALKQLLLAAMATILALILLRVVARFIEGKRR